jgi:hypothetical protein
VSDLSQTGAAGLDAHPAGGDAAAGYSRPEESERWSERLRSLLGARPPRQPRFSPSPAAVEEEAASRLYGERTGTVNASPASCPVPVPAVRDERGRVCGQDTGGSFS